VCLHETLCTKSGKQKTCIQITNTLSGPCRGVSPYSVSCDRFAGTYHHSTSHVQNTGGSFSFVATGLCQRHTGRPTCLPCTSTLVVNASERMIFHLRRSDHNHHWRAYQSTRYFSVALPLVRCYPIRPHRRVASWVNYSSRWITESSSEHFVRDLSWLKADALWCENKRCWESNPWPMDPKASEFKVTWYVLL